MVLLISMFVMFESGFATKTSDVFISVTTGSKQIINHKIQHAKQTAVANALKLAVKNAFASLVTSQVMSSNLGFLYDQILSHSSDYIITYRIFSGIEHKNNFLVSVESNIDLALLEQTLLKAKILDTKEQTFNVNIQGKNFLARFIKLKQKLKQIPGIENMQPLEIGSDYTIMQIVYKGNSSQFADLIMLKTFSLFGLEILDVKDDFINIRFIEKK